MMVLALLLPGAAQGEQGRLGASVLREIRAVKAARIDPGSPPPVELYGVVTHATGLESPARELVIQDNTGGIWVRGEAARLATVRLGDGVRVTGRVEPGRFAPAIVADAVDVVGREALPEPARADREALLTGAYDGVFVEISGRIRAVRQVDVDGAPWTLLAVGSRSQRLHAMVPSASGGRQPPAIGSLVRVRGVCAYQFNPAGQILSAQLRMSALWQVQSLEAAPPPGAAPLMEIGNLLRPSSPVNFARPVRVRGVVQAQEADRWILLTDGDASLRVWCAVPKAYALGDLVEACGFAVPAAAAPELEDATVAVIGTGIPAAPLQTSPAKALKMGGRLVSVRGRLIGVEPAGRAVRLLMEAEGARFVASVPIADGGLGSAIAPGAMLEATGVSMVWPGPESGPGAGPAPIRFDLAARDASDIHLVAPSPWWTPERVRGASAGLAALCGGLAWLWMRQRRKSRRLAAAKEALRKHRDALVRTVETRTGQLQERIVLQHRSRTEAAAVFTERARLARDLHDSLGRTLASAKRRVESLGEGALAADATAVHGQLTDVSGLLDSCQKELQRSIWNLRRPEIDRQHLADVLQESVRLLFDGSGVAAAVEVSGTPRALPLEMETNLLRFAQEALANALKHAAAQAVKVKLAYRDETLRLSVRDNGRGFDPATQGSPNCGGGGGRFGLHAMEERAKTVGGTLAISSRPGRGTTVTLEAPVPASPRGASAWPILERVEVSSLS